jgi:hypothetical protein
LALYEHSCGTSKRIVIHTPMLVGGVVAQIVHVYLCQSFLLGSTQNAFLREGFDEFGQYGDDVYSHVIC